MCSSCRMVVTSLERLAPAGSQHQGGIDSLRTAPSGPLFSVSLPFLTMPGKGGRASQCPSFKMLQEEQVLTSDCLLESLAEPKAALLPSLCFLFFLFLLVLGIKPRTWWMLGRCSIIGSHPQSFGLFASLLTGPLSITAASAAPLQHVQ